VSATTSSAPATSAVSPTGWIHSAAYDVSLLLLAPLVGVPLMLAMPAVPSTLGLVACALLGFPHYLSTFTFYFWDENREHHRRRWGAYFAGPVALAAAFLTIFFLDRPAFLWPAALFFWNAVHVSRQSSGLVSIYRHRAGVRDVDAQVPAADAILLVSLWLSLANIETHTRVFLLLTAVDPELLRFVRMALGIAAIAALARLAVSLSRRTARGAGLRAPELLALLCGLTLFHPYLWVADSAKATLGMLVGHFLQYLALVWLVQRRRAEASSAVPRKPALHALSSDLRVLVPVFVLAGAGMIGAFLTSTRLGFAGYYQALFLTLVFLHFYLDGLFWAFKDPHVRTSLGPYLSAPTGR
jgi:hypothetical protein